MGLQEARIQFKKKRLWWWSKILVVLIIIINFAIYLRLFLINGQCQDFTHQDLLEIRMIQLVYSFPWWSNIIFSFLWLAYAQGIYWYLHLDHLKLNHEKLHLPCMRPEAREIKIKELDTEIFCCEALQLSFNFGGVALGLLAAIYFGGALYGLVANILFDLYAYFFMIILMLAWSYLSPIYKFIFKRK